jgi:hypothetical protein
MISLLNRIMATLSMLRKESQRSATPFFRLTRDVTLFCLRTGLGPRYYVVAGMASEEYPAGAKWLHVSARKYYRAVDLLNPPAYRKVTQHKLLEKGLYGLLQIPTAPFIGYFHPEKGFDSAGRPLRDIEQLAVLLSQHSGKRFCAKPVEGWGGSGVCVFAVQTAQGETCLSRHPGGEPVALAQLLSSYAAPDGRPEFILEGYLEQTSEFMNFNRDSLNTVRLWVLERREGVPEVLGAYLRVGRAGQSVDNASAGGLIFPVELASGRLRPGLTKHSPHREEIIHHPDNHYKIAGSRLKDWNAIVDFSCAVLARLPMVRFAGLDVSMTERGPVLVEANVVPDKVGAAHANIPSLLIWQAAVRQSD